MRYAPSLACANQLCLEADIQELERCGLSTLHLDVMDGHYVPNLCLSIDAVRAMKQRFPAMQLDVHLMATEPERYVERMRDAGVDYLTFHASSTPFAYRLASAIHAAGMKAGLAINPSEPPDILLPVLPQVELVLVMSVEPGFSGQKFIPHCMQRVRELADMRARQGLSFEISVDGGITPALGRELRQNGADWLVLGYPAIFQQPEGIQGSFARFSAAVEADGQS